MLVQRWVVFIKNLARTRYVVFIVSPVCARALMATPSLLRQFTTGAAVPRSSGLASLSPTPTPTPSAPVPSVATDTARLARVHEQLRAVHALTRASLVEQEHVCAACGKRFHEATNIGQWQCWMHTGSLDPSTRRWWCCGRGERLCGCQPCDHRAGTPWPIDEKHALELPTWAESWIRAPLLAAVDTDGTAVDAGWVVMDIRVPEDRRSDAEETLYRQWVERNRRFVMRVRY